MNITPVEIEFLQAMSRFDQVERLIIVTAVEALVRGECSIERFEAHSRHLFSKHHAGGEIAEDDLRGFCKSEVSA